MAAGALLYWLLGLVAASFASLACLFVYALFRNTLFGAGVMAGLPENLIKFQQVWEWSLVASMWFIIFYLTLATLIRAFRKSTVRGGV